MAKRRVKLLSAQPMGDELHMTGAVVDLDEGRAKQLESRGRAVWAPHAKLTPRPAKGQHRRLADRGMPSKRGAEADKSEEKDASVEKPAKADTNAKGAAQKENRGSTRTRRQSGNAGKKS